MIAVLDTNVIMDALQERSPFDIEAKQILKHGQDSKQFACLFTANAATDIFYLYSKARDIKSAQVALDFLLDNYSVVPITHENCKEALRLPIDDFEDALVVVCARHANANYIVTRDAEFLQVDSPIPLISPKEFVAKHIKIT